MAEPVRILQVVGKMDRGGAETLIMNLYRRIDRGKVQFDFAVQTDRKCDFDDEIKDLGGRIFNHPHPREAGIFNWSTRLRETIRKQGPFGGVHCHMLFMSGIVVRAAERSGIPVRIAHAHNTRDSEGNSWGRRLYRRLTKHLILKHSTHIFGCSTRVCEWMYSNSCWKDPRIRAVTNAINLDRFKGLHPDRQTLRKKLALPLTGPLIGHVGAFRRQKNHGFLVEIFAAIKRFLSESNLIMAGNGLLRPDVEKMVNDRGLSDSVHFLGVRTDVPELLATLDLFLFPSFYEGVPVALIEAQAAGAPFVTTDSVYLDGDLKMGLGEGVSLSEPPEVWAKKCVDALSRKRPAWGERELALRAAGYDMGQVAHDLEGIYTSGRRAD